MIALSYYVVPRSIDEYGVALWTFRGNGDGTFQPGVRQSLFQSAVYSGVPSLAVGDLNGDGKPDVAILLGFAVPYLIALGNGDGTLTVLPDAALQQGGSSQPNSVALADFNGDGKLDLVIGPLFNPFNQSGVGVAIGNGDGTFQPPVLYSALIGYFAGAGQIAVGDVNGDGIPDIVTSGGSILFGDGKGSFPSRRDYASNASGAVMLGDFDGDGKVEIIVGNGNPALLSGNLASSTLTVLFGQGGGAFTTSPVAGEGQILGYSGPISTAANFDGDGVPDLALLDIQSLTVLKGKGNGEFSSVFRYGFAISYLYPVSLAVADFNRDGKPDIAVLLEDPGSQGQVQIFSGNGDGTLAAGVALPVPVAIVGEGSFIAAADFNGDGIADLVATAVGGVWVWLGKSDGTFSSPASYAFPGAFLWSLALGDFNRDGKTDIAVADSTDGNITILLGKGDGTFSPGTVIPVSVPDGAGGLVLGPANLVAGDFNGDRALDLAVTLWDRQTNNRGIAILAGKGDGTFQPPVIDPEQAGGIAIADINGDKIPDLIVGDALQGTVVRIGNGDGTFQAAISILSSPLGGFF